MESQFSRETQIELYFSSILNSKFRKSNYLEKYKNFEDSRQIPISLSWEEMKHKYDWGYRKGSVINNLITWIYLRPDIKKDLDTGRFDTKDLVKYFKLNEHYFLVEQKAIEYFKLHCGGYLQEDEINDKESPEELDEENNSIESEMSYQTLKRRKLYSAPIGIDDTAIESN